MTYTTLKYEVDGRVARITLNRPDKLNAINDEMPAEIAAAADAANDDPAVHVIVLAAEGRAFCAGYDLQRYAEAPGPLPGSQDMPWDPMEDYRLMGRNTRCFMRLWRGLKPVVCKVQGFAVAGGSDIALCCDQIVMATDAKIGYPPARVWGCPTTGMWVYRLGAERAKRMLLTGQLIDGATAERWGLASEAVPAGDLDDAVEALVGSMASVPANQLIMHKMMINSAFENMGLSTTQTLATVFDGMARHTPEGVAFKKRCEEVGFKQAVAERDSGKPISE